MTNKKINKVISLISMILTLLLSTTVMGASSVTLTQTVNPNKVTAPTATTKASFTVNGYADTTTFAVDFITCIDHSGSMEGNKIVSARDGAKQVVDELNLGGAEGHRNAVIKFNSTATVVQGFTDDATLLKNQIDGITASGGTSFPAAINAMVDLASDPANVKMGMLLSDGLSGGAWEVAANNAKGKIVIHTIAVGNDADETALRRIAEITGGEYRKAVDASTIPDVMKSIVTGIDFTAGRNVKLEVAVSNDPIVNPFTVVSNIPAQTSDATVGNITTYTYELETLLNGFFDVFDINYDGQNLVPGVYNVTESAILTYNDAKDGTLKTVTLPALQVEVCEDRILILHWKGDNAAQSRYVNDLTGNGHTGRNYNVGFNEFGFTFPRHDSHLDFIERFSQTKLQLEESVILELDFIPASSNESNQVLFYRGEHQAYPNAVVSYALYQRNDEFVFEIQQADGDVDYISYQLPLIDGNERYQLVGKYNKDLRTLVITDLSGTILASKETTVVPKAVLDAGKNPNVSLGHYPNAYSTNWTQPFKGTIWEVKVYK